MFTVTSHEGNANENHNHVYFTPTRMDTRKEGRKEEGRGKEGKGREGGSEDRGHKVPTHMDVEFIGQIFTSTDLSARPDAPARGVRGTRTSKPEGLLVASRVGMRKRRQGSRELQGALGTLDTALAGFSAQTVNRKCRQWQCHTPRGAAEALSGGDVFRTALQWRPEGLGG